MTQLFFLMTCCMSLAVYGMDDYQKIDVLAHVRSLCRQLRTEINTHMSTPFPYFFSEQIPTLPKAIVRDCSRLAKYHETAGNFIEAAFDDAAYIRALIEGDCIDNKTRDAALSEFYLIREDLRKYKEYYSRVCVLWAKFEVDSLTKTFKLNEVGEDVADLWPEKYLGGLDELIDLNSTQDN